MWGSDKRRWVPYAAAFALFVGALLSKTVTCTLPATLLIVLWWKRGRIRWARAAARSFFVVGAQWDDDCWIERIASARWAVMGPIVCGSLAGRGTSVTFTPPNSSIPHPLSFVYECGRSRRRLATMAFPARVIALLGPCGATEADRRVRCSSGGVRAILAGARLRERLSFRFSFVPTISSTWRVLPDHAGRGEVAVMGQRRWSACWQC